VGGEHSGEVVGWGVKVDLGHCVRCLRCWAHDAVGFLGDFMLRNCGR